MCSRVACTRMWHSSASQHNLVFAGSGANAGYARWLYDTNAHFPCFRAKMLLLKLNAEVCHAIFSAILKVHPGSSKVMAILSPMAMSL